jgi:hypothetical protein
VLSLILCGVLTPIMIWAVCTARWRKPLGARQPPDDPAGMGLDVSFWTLLRWKFWRDPLYKAERRSFWNPWRRLAIWALGAGSSVTTCYLFMPGWGVMWYEVRWLRSFVLISLVAAAPMIVLAPLVVTAGFCGRKQADAAENLIITPIAPLRLVAARLLGRCLPLARVAAASVLGLWAIAPVGWDQGVAPLWIHGLSDLWEVWENSLWVRSVPGEVGTYVLTALGSALLCWTCAIIAGAIALHVAVRARGPARAIVGGYLRVMLMASLVMLFEALRVCVPWWTGGCLWAPSGALSLVLTVLLVGGALWFSVMGAARWLVLRLAA